MIKEKFEQLSMTYHTLNDILRKDTTQTIENWPNSGPGHYKQGLSLVRSLNWEILCEIFGKKFYWVSYPCDALVKGFVRSKEFLLLGGIWMIRYFW